ncbi:MAG: hypothetical protein ACU0HS_16700 [Paracoccus sp. (in: a-proteobacteria)]|uniref:hypothetical protein n=1 Tax=Paracoccus sp. TaxID=267 RepID=UPI004058FD98
MDKCKRYNIKALNQEAYEAAVEILGREAQVVLMNPTRKTIAVEGLEEATAQKLREMNVSATEEVQYDLE